MFLVTGFITVRRSACRWGGLGKVTKPKQPWVDRMKAAHGFSVFKAMAVKSHGLFLSWGDV